MEEMRAMLDNSGAGSKCVATLKAPCSMRRALTPILLIYRHRLLLYYTVKQEFTKRYAGSALGLLWLIGQPLLMLAAYAAVFVFVFKAKYGLFDSNEYVLMIFCGLIPFFGFSESLGSGTGSVAANPSLIKNTLFPIELVPVRSVLASHGIQAAATVMLLLAITIDGRLTATVLWLPVLWTLQLMFLFGLLWVLSALNVFLRDLQQVIGAVVMLLMMVSPIAYTMDMVPESLRPMIIGNPVAHFIFCYQNVIFLGEAPPMKSFLIIAIGAPLMFYAGFALFRRLKPVMADHV